MLACLHPAQTYRPEDSIDVVQELEVLLFNALGYAEQAL